MPDNTHQQKQKLLAQGFGALVPWVNSSVRHVQTARFFQDMENIRAARDEAQHNLKLLDALVRDRGLPPQATQKHKQIYRRWKDMTPHFTEKDWEETREWIVPEQTKLRDYLSDLRQVEARWPDRSWAQQQVLPWNIRQQATIQEQKQRRKAYKGFTPGLQGAGAVYLQKTIPRNSWDKPDQSLLDPITDQLLQDPVVANDKRVYNRQTAELLIRDRLRGQTGVRVQTYDDRPPRLAALRASVRQFQKTHQKTPDALGRYQRKPTKDTRH